MATKMRIVVACFFCAAAMDLAGAKAKSLTGLESQTGTATTACSGGDCGHPARNGMREIDAIGEIDAADNYGTTSEPMSLANRTAEIERAEAKQIMNLTADSERMMGAILHLENATSSRARTMFTLLSGVPDSTTLFQNKDKDAWLVFVLSFVVLLVADLCFVSKLSSSSITSAFAVTGMWCGAGLLFNGYIFHRFGQDAGWQWASAYCLEWLLSFDNLFVFHCIFNMHATPEHMRRRPLFLGMLGAVFLRLMFLTSAEYILHIVQYAHFAIGFLLIYTAYNTLQDDDEMQSTDNMLVRSVCKHLPMVRFYDQDGAFFVQVRPGPDGDVNKENHSHDNQAPRPLVWRATLLVLVVVCIESADLCFAFDSVSAVVAQVSDLFLAYSAVVFAMLSLRAGYFVVGALAETFALFKYGIAACLCFVGAKLIFSKVFTVPPVHACCALFFILSLSVIASQFSDALAKESEAKGSKGSKGSTDIRDFHSRAWVGAR